MFGSSFFFCLIELIGKPGKMLMHQLRSILITTRSVSCSIVLIISVLAALPSVAAPQSERWQRWETFDATSTRTVDHSAWDLFVLKYGYPGKDGINRMAYGIVHSTDRQILDAYINSLAAVKVTTLNRKEQFAYWVNLYNALTVQVILEHYPVSSIRDIDISPGLFSDGPWGKALVKVEGVALSLDDIEYRILRPIWKDPRIHYAVNCAALGCPQINWPVITAKNTEEYLDKATRVFINSPNGARLARLDSSSPADGKLILSSLYSWYVDDFGGTEEAVLRHLARYADPPLAALLENGASISGYAYDWTLNSVKPTIGDRVRKRGS